MLAIRMQRTGRRGHAQYRVIVQDSRFHPTSGRVVALLGSYNPHTKQASVDKETAEKYLSNGAVPSPRAVKILKQQGLKMPDWVKETAPRQRDTRNPDKRRSTRPPEPEAETPAAEAEVEQEPANAVEETAPAEPVKNEDTAAEAQQPEAAAEEPAGPAEKPAEPEAPAEA